MNEWRVLIFSYCSGKKIRFFLNLTDGIDLASRALRTQNWKPRPFVDSQKLHAGNYVINHPLIQLDQSDVVGARIISSIVSRLCNSSASFCWCIKLEALSTDKENQTTKNFWSTNLYMYTLYTCTAVCSPHISYCIRKFSIYSEFP